ncbi:hypothetical protein [Streptomyces sp. NPDC050145]|uniref:hypothetical protein n=1 Tax=Streptomyces sp. NPDC050145 TaxID=3365602 RepID=UPI00379379AA
MSPSVPELPSRVVDELGDRIASTVEVHQMMVLTADDADAAEQAAASVLSTQDVSRVHVTVRAPANRTTVIDALYAALFPGAWHGARPRILSDAEREIDAELARPGRTALVVRDAQQLRTDGLTCPYGTWRAADDRNRPLSLALTGTPRLAQVLKRPLLDSVNSRIYTRYHLSSS